MPSSVKLSEASGIDREWRRLLWGSKGYMSSVARLHVCEHNKAPAWAKFVASYQVHWAGLANNATR